MERPGVAAKSAEALGCSFDSVDLLLIPSPAQRALSDEVAATPLMSARSAWS
jgi:hypothetical protein